MARLTACCERRDASRNSDSRVIPDSPDPPVCVHPLPELPLLQHCIGRPLTTLHVVA